MLTAACSRDNTAKSDLVSIVSGAVGLQEEAAKPAGMLDIVIDTSDGNPGSITTVESTIKSALTYAAERHGTSVPTVAGIGWPSFDAAVQRLTANTISPSFPIRTTD